jgi:hypothetical protein
LFSIFLNEGAEENMGVAECGWAVVMALRVDNAA